MVILGFRERVNEVEQKRVSPDHRHHDHYYYYSDRCRRRPMKLLLLLVLLVWYLHDPLNWTETGRR